jgi:hypothetical protein
MSIENTDFNRSAVVLSFFCGAVGGAAPSLLDLATRARIEQLPSGGYYIAMAIFAFLGGFLALVYKETITHKAFFLGIGAPALIVAGGKAVDSGTAWRLDPGLTKTAYAQENTSLAPPTAGMIEDVLAKGHRLVFVSVDRSILESDRIDAQLSLETTGQGGKREVVVSSGHQRPNSSSGPDDPWTVGTATLPGDTVAIALKGQITLSGQGPERTLTIRTEPENLPPDGSTLLVVLQRRVSFWAGFFDGIGMKNLARRQTDYRISIEPTEPKKETSH